MLRIAVIVTAVAALVSNSLAAQDDEVDISLGRVAVTSARPKLRDRLTFEATVKNSGSKKLRAHTVRVTFELTDPKGFTRKFTKTQSLSGLKPGESKTVTSPAAFTAIHAGRYEIKASAHFNSKLIKESNADNNSALSTFSVQKAVEQGTDIAITNITVRPPQPLPGGTVISHICYRNNGESPIKNIGYRARLIRDGRQVQNGGKGTIALVSGGSSGFWHMNWRNLEEGDYEIVAEVDPRDLLPEDNEKNNVYRVKFKVGIASALPVKDEEEDEQDEENPGRRKKQHRWRL